MLIFLKVFGEMSLIFRFIFFINFGEISQRVYTHVKYLGDNDISTKIWAYNVQDFDPNFRHFNQNLCSRF